jgi:hypothetical protein
MKRIRLGMVLVGKLGDENVKAVDEPRYDDVFPAQRSA